MWFERLTGFKEISTDNVKEKLVIEGEYFISKPTGQRFKFGKLEIPSLAELKEETPDINSYNSKIQVKEIIGDVTKLHTNPENKNALFQAASQFNLLEMVGPHISPEQGIERYENDFTQGPACAIACGAGTIYRNYFVPIKNQIGQTQTLQIDCLDLMGKELKNDELAYWRMKNGYAMMNQTGLLAINKKLASIKGNEKMHLKDQLKVGIQWNTEVTLSRNKQDVSQIYCSALPVSYCGTEQFYWEYFARLILETAYEASLYAALINLEKNKSNKLFLTLLGGGAFGNSESWILDAIQNVILKFRKTPLDVYIVSYNKSNDNLRNRLKKLQHDIG